MYSIYIYIYIYIHTLLPLTKPRIANIIQSQKPIPSSTRVLPFFFFFSFLLPLVFPMHEDKSLTQDFIELYSSSTKSINKKIIYQKAVDAPSLRQAVIYYYYFFSSINPIQFLKKISQNTQAAMAKESLMIGQNTNIRKYSNSK